MPRPPRPRPLGTSLFLLLLPLPTAASATPASLALAQTDWIRAAGGLVHPSLAIRPLDPSDPFSLPGLFADGPLSEGETLLRIPRRLTPFANGDECGAARALASRRETGATSPHEEYLYEAVRERAPPLPSQWSDNGSIVLHNLLGEELEPAFVADMTYEIHCGLGDEEDEEEEEDDEEYQKKEEAFHLVRRMGFNGTLVPLYDLCEHRNGQGPNVDATSFEEEEEDVTVYARRDIPKGERLHMSRGDCDVNCRGMSWHYGTAHVLRDAGYLEDYPQRWVLRAKNIPMSFHLEKEGEGHHGLTVTWNIFPPNEDQTRFLLGHLLRLKDIEDTLKEDVEEYVEAPHEKETILQFFQHLKTAMQYAYWYSDMVEDQDEDQEEVCVLGSDVCARGYDDFKPQYIEPFENYYTSFIHNPGNIFRSFVGPNEKLQTSYQKLEFFHHRADPDQNPDEGPKSNTCMYIDTHINVCTSLRPHYHEVFVHYPASFLPANQVKRVAFIGGGDNMVVHEVLKYSSLELVVGLELDQGVGRASFKHFGTQPHFDDPRVEWWFGDGAKSFLLFPESYFGSFDLVLVDLMSYVMAELRVDDDLSFMDAAVRLLDPKKGVMAMNYDLHPPQTKYMDYTVDLYFTDVPIFCKQGVTITSGAVDFLTAPQVDHNLDNLFWDLNYVKDVERQDVDTKYDLWYNYWNCSSPDSRRRNCTPVKAPAYEEDDDDDYEEDFDAGAAESTGIGSLGSFLVLEAEDARRLTEGIPQADAFKQTLTKAGLTTITFQQTISESDNTATVVLLLKEGYVVARMWPQHEYCAFDILLWSSFNKMEGARRELLAMLGGDQASSSSYRMVMGGMNGAIEEGKEADGAIGPPRHAPTTNPSESYPEDAASSSPAQQDVLGTVLSESLALIWDRHAVVAVFCGEESQPCPFYDMMVREEFENLTVVPFHTCPSPVLSQACEDATQNRLRAAVLEHGSRFNGLVVDVSLSLSMGQVLHRVLDHGMLRGEVLEDAFVAMDAAFLSTDSAEASWRRGLLDRIHRYFVRYSPAFLADVRGEGEGGGWNLGVVSGGDDYFLSHLAEVLEELRDTHGIASEILAVKNGINRYVAMFEPSFIAGHDDFDMESGRRQWDSQRPLGRQSMVRLGEEGENSGLPLLRFSFSLNAPQMENAVRGALQSMQYLGHDADAGEAEVKTHPVGEGCLVMALWKGGNAVAHWDGGGVVNINLFSQNEEEELHRQFVQDFINSVPSLSVLQVEAQPRGYGRVVNFQADIERENGIFQF